MKSVCQYSSCRDYLRAAFLNAKKGSPGLTMDKYAKKVGLNPSTFKMILSGKRHLSLAFMHRVAQKLQLAPDEQNYFEAMTLRELSKGSSEKRFYVERAKAAKESTQLSTVLFSGKELLSDPMIVPILVYLMDIKKQLPGAQEFPQVTAETVSQAFQIKLARAQTALKILEKSGVWSEATPGTEIHFVFDQLTNILSQKQFLKNWLLEAASRIESDYENSETFFNASTISLSPALMLKLKDDLRALFEKYMSSPATAGEKTKLAQVCVQCFPLL